MSFDWSISQWYLISYDLLQSYLRVPITKESREGAVLSVFAGVAG